MEQKEEECFSCGSVTCDYRKVKIGFDLGLPVKTYAIHIQCKACQDREREEYGTD